MKPFDELTHDELIALDDTAINYYIDRACADEGVPLLPPTPPEQPKIEQIEKSVVHYTIAGLRFLDEADARSVEAAIAATKSRRTVQTLGTYRWNDPTHDAPETDPIIVGMDRVFDVDGAARQKAETDRTADRKAAYEEAKKTYDSALNGRENVSRHIRNAVSAAWKLEHRRRDLLHQYQRYIPLANGDELVAKRFLQKAYSDARDVLPGLYPDGWNDVVRAMPAPEVEAEAAPF